MLYKNCDSHKLMIKTYKFGIIPKSHIEEINNIFKVSNWFYNDLVAAVRGKQQLYKDITNSGTDALVNEEKQLYSLVKEIDNKIKDNRILSSSKKDDPLLIKELKLRKENHKIAAKKLASARKNNKISYYTKSKYDEIRALQAQMHKDIRKHYVSNYNLYWGTYNLIHEAVEATEKSIYKDRNGCHGFVKFNSFSNEGRLGLQFIKTVSQPEYRNTSNLFVEKSKISNQIFILKKESSYQKNVKHHGKRSQNKAELNFCIGTGSKQKPITAKFDIILHRDIPQGIIKKAVINKVKNGSKIEWSLDLCIDVDDVKSQVHNGKSIAFDLGWRNIGSEKYRIASWKDSDNNSGFINLDIASLNKANDLQSKVDDYFELFKPYLHYFMSNYMLPSWLEKNKLSLLKTRSKDKILKLFFIWKNNRFNGDELIFKLLSEWRYRHNHLYDYTTGKRRKFLRNRKQKYLTLAKEMSQKYEKVIFENLKLDNMAKGKVAGGQRVKSAPSEFKNAFQNRYYEHNIIEVDAKNTSKECGFCGSNQDLDAQVTQHTCTKCLSSYDRDINAAGNILKKGLSSFASGSMAQQLLQPLANEITIEIKEVASR